MFSSSNAPLGDNAYPASEDKPVAPLSPYGAGKATGEAYCSAFFGAYGLEAVAVVPGAPAELSYPAWQASRKDAVEALSYD